MATQIGDNASVIHQSFKTTRSVAITNYFNFVKNLSAHGARCTWHYSNNPELANEPFS